MHGFPRRKASLIVSVLGITLGIMALGLATPSAVAAQLIGEEAELDRLQEKAEASMALGDLEGAALNIGKAALMASILAKKEPESDAGQIYQGMAWLFRAQENTYRAIALFQRGGEGIPASSGVCYSLALGAQDVERSQEPLGVLAPTDQDQQRFRAQALEWTETIKELQADLECPR